MTRVVLMLLILGGAFLFIAKTLFDFFGGISGTASVLERDLRSLQDRLREYLLTPWEHDEMDLLSRQVELSSKMGATSYEQLGTYQSIYQEPILAFGSKEYKNRNRRIAAVRYNDREYGFIIRGSKATIYSNGKAKGDILLKDGLKIIRGTRTLTIDLQSSSDLKPVILNGKPMLFIDADENPQTDQTRLIQKLASHDDAEGDLLQLAVAFAVADRLI
ncbi:MAG: hypothetical protein AAFQ02_03315 [Bacteroidota bacterium]